MDRPKIRNPYGTRRPTAPVLSPAPVETHHRPVRVRGRHKPTLPRAHRVDQSDVQKSYRKPRKPILQGQGNQVPAHRYHRQRPHFLGPPNVAEDDGYDDGVVYDDEVDYDNRVAYDNRVVYEDENVNQSNEDESFLQTNDPPPKKSLPAIDPQATYSSQQLNDIHHMVHANNELLKEILAILTKLPLDIAQVIVQEIKHQSNPATQASTTHAAPVHTGSNPTVNPSSLTSNNRAGQGNNGG